MTYSDNLVNKLKVWEGYKRTAYNDSGDRLTIGVGHALTKSERTSGKIVIDGEAVRFKNGLSNEEINKLLRQDLDLLENEVIDALDINAFRLLNQNQFDAIMSFVFNVGTYAFEKSTLLKKLNAGEFGNVPAQLRRWVHDNGNIIPGLVARREKEIELWGTT